MVQNQVPSWIQQQYGHILASFEKLEANEQTAEMPEIIPQSGGAGIGRVRETELSREEIIEREKSQGRKQLRDKPRRCNKRDTIRRHDSTEPDTTDIMAGIYPDYN